MCVCICAITHLTSSLPSLSLDAATCVSPCPQRVNGVLAISRALGDHMLKEKDIVSAAPFCATTTLTDEVRPLAGAHAHTLCMCVSNVVRLHARVC